MHRLFFLLFFLPHETISAATAGGASGCNRQRDSVIVPYPFGFSGDCPIVLDFNDTTSTPLLPHNATAGAGAAAYTIMSFDANTSTFVVSIAPSCTRTVSDTRASLTGARYGVSSRTGIFLRGGCSNSSSRGAPANASSRCTVPSELMTGLLRTARCGDGNDTAWTCVTSAPPDPGTPAAARGEGQFMRWDRVEDAGCQDALTSAVYADTPQGVPSVEFGVAELGWWLDGGCAGAGGGCAANATCGEVVTPAGALGHRCACRDGMVGDGFAAGEGCRFGAPTAGECFHL